MELVFSDAGEGELETVFAIYRKAIREMGRFCLMEKGV